MIKNIHICNYRGLGWSLTRQNKVTSTLGQLKNQYSANAHDSKKVVNGEYLLMNQYRSLAMISKYSHGILPKQQQQSTREGLKVVVLVNVSLVTQLDVPKHLSKQEEKGPPGYRQLQAQSICRRVRFSDLHANDGVDEEEHGDEEANIWERFEGLDEGPKENPDCVALSQQFDQASCSEQLQEAHVKLFNRLEERARKGRGVVVTDAVVNGMVA